MQAVVRIQRQRRIGVGRIGPRDLQGRAGLVIEVAAGGDDRIGGVIGPAQEHHQDAGLARRRRPDAAGDEHGRCRGGASQQIAAMHRGSHLCMNSGDDRNSAFQSVGVAVCPRASSVRGSSDCSRPECDSAVCSCAGAGLTTGA